MPRVAHIITRLIIGGAQENTLFNVDDQHHRHGDEVCLITGPGLGPEGTLEEKARRRGLDLRVLPEMQRSLHPWRDWQCYRALCRMLQDYRPELVHTHSSKAGILGRRAASRLGIPCVHSIHGASFHYGQPQTLHLLYQTAERIADRWCDHYITVCDAMAQQYLDAGIGTPDKFTTVYSGMDVEQFIRPRIPPNVMRERLGLSSDDIVFGKIARLFHLKGHEHLVEAAPEIVRSVPNARFLLIGDGILKDALQRRIDELGLTDRFVFTGLVAPDEIGEHLHAMDVLIHASRWEGLARVLPQALISGKPVISFDIDGAPEVCRHDDTGLLVPPGDEAGLAEAAVRLGTDPVLRRHFGNRGRELFTEIFRHEFMTERIREVYERVLQQRSHAAAGSGTGA